MDAKATPAWTLTSPYGTTGVQDLGMYRGLILELGRSLGGRARLLRFDGQGVMSESKIIPLREVRCLHSSEEPGPAWKEVG